MARPSKYDPAFPEQARKLCLLGATDLEIADFFEVSVASLYRWKNEHPEFCEALKEGKAEADKRVEESLYQRALGYSHEAVKIFNNGGEIITANYREHYPPDTTAAIFWLKNRQPERWRDKHEVEHSHRVEQMSDDELARIAGLAPAGGKRAVAPKGNSSKPH
jgi:hypothetical protein